MPVEGAATDVAPKRTWWWRQLLVPVVVVAVLVLLATTLADINWSDVGAALSQLVFWQIVLLLLVVAVRQILTAVPLHLLVPELGLGRALINDLSANLVATVSPAPSDLVLRIGMFRAWKVDPKRGVTGLVLQSLLFYVTRLVAPVVGFGLLLLAIEDVDPVYGAAAVSSGLLALALAIGIRVAARSQGSARRLGALGVRIVRRVRPSTQGLDTWPDRAAEFQSEAGGLLRRRAPVIGLNYAVLLFVEATLLLLALRMVGITSTDASAVLIIAAFLCVYPLTGLPLLGLGVLDAALIALIYAGSNADPDDLVAGVIVWRVAFQLVPLALGALTLTQWRRGQRASK
jgi:uncharacterized membrane protein YbhN (UPF0104 family)